MSLFHPAVYGILYAALRDHEQNKTLAEDLAGMYDTSPQVSYHGDVIESLNDLLEMLEAAETEDTIERQQLAKHDARRQDEDQSTPQPAAPARGHGQDDVLHASPPIGDGKNPRCGADGRTALFAADVTCEACITLLIEQDVTGYSAEQLAGDACMVCARAFADGDWRDAIGGRRGRDVYAHYDCDDPSYDPTQPAPPTGEPS